MAPQIPQLISIDESYNSHLVFDDGPNFGATCFGNFVARNYPNPVCIPKSCIAIYLKTLVEGLLSLQRGFFGFVSDNLRPFGDNG